MIYIYCHTKLHCMGLDNNIIMYCRKHSHFPVSIWSQLRIAVQISCMDSSLGRVPACDAGELDSIPGGGKLIVCP
jgi:hypothetical protein